MPPNCSPNRVRLREKCSNLAGNVLKNGTTLSQNGIYTVYDGKTFCIQILDADEDLSLKFKFDKIPSNDDSTEIVQTDINENSNSHNSAKNENFSDESINENILRLYAEKCLKMKNAKVVINDSNSNSNSSDNNDNSDIMNNNEKNDNKNNNGGVNNKEENDTVTTMTTVHRIPDSDAPLQNIPTVLLQVQHWCRRTFTVEEKIEIFVRQDETVKSLSKRLSVYYKIPYLFLRILFAPVNHEIYLCELPSNRPTKYSSRIWFDGSADSRKLSELCDVRLDDGDVLILQNIREPLRELTEMEITSVRKKSQVSNYYGYTPSVTTSTSTSTSTATCAIADYNSQNMKSSYSNFENSTYTTAVQYGVKNKKKENGIRIKTHKDRMKESNKENETTKEKPHKILTLTHDPQNIPSHKEDSDFNSSEGKKSTEIINLNEEKSKFTSSIEDEKNYTDINMIGYDDEKKRNENSLGGIQDQDSEPFLGTDDEAKKMGFDLFLD